VPQPHILYVVRTLDIGGTERHLAAIAPRLVRRGWKISVYSLAGRGPLLGELQRGEVTVLTPRIGGDGSSRSILGRGLYLAMAAVDLLVVLLKQKPDVVHFFLPAAYLIGAPLAIIARVPIRVMSRQSLNLYQRGVPLARMAERFLHRKMSCILAVSLPVLAELRDEEGVPADRLAVLYNGIETELFLSAPCKQAARAELGLDPAALVMVIVANLIPYKGHGDLLEALALARADLPDDWCLLIVGRDDGIGPELRDQSKRLSIDQKVRFLGQRKDVPAILSASDVGIIASHQEGFSIAVLEGMAAALGMIVTDVGGNSEAIVDGESGLVVPPRDPMSLAQGIRRLARDPQLRASLGQAARRRVQQKFSLGPCVLQYERLYRALVASSPMPIGEILSGAENSSE
jgi:glycosyltransferase involved in cell wall biosynthesis